MLSGYDGYYDREMILENFDRGRLIRIIENLADLIDETREILKIGLNRGEQNDRKEFQTDITK